MAEPVEQQFLKDIYRLMDLERFRGIWDKLHWQLGCQQVEPKGLVPCCIDLWLFQWNMSGPIDLGQRWDWFVKGRSGGGKGQEMN